MAPILVTTLSLSPVTTVISIAPIFSYHIIYSILIASISLYSVAILFMDRFVPYIQWYIIHQGAPILF